jgi:hypothetical protein
VGQAFNSVDAPQAFTEFAQGAVSSTVTQAMVGGKVNAASVISDGFGNVQGDDLRAAFSGNGQQERQLAQMQQQVMTSTDVGVEGDARLFGPMGAAGGYANAGAPVGSANAAGNFGSYSSDSILYGPNPYGGSGASDTGSYCAASVLFGPSEGIGSASAATPATYTAQKGEGPLAIAMQLNPDNPYAAMAYLAATGQMSFSPTANRWMTYAGQTYSADLSSLSDDQIAALDAMGRKGVSAEATVDMQRAQAILQAQQAQAAAYREANRFAAFARPTKTLRLSRLH